jgi:hypothetical protein
MIHIDSMVSNGIVKQTFLSLWSPLRHLLHPIAKEYSYWAGMTVPGWENHRKTTPGLQTQFFATTQLVNHGNARALFQPQG